MFKKNLCLLLSAVMLASVAAGCGQPANTPTPPAGAQSPAANSTAGTPATPATGPEALTLPISEQPLTLTCFMEMDPKVAASKKSVSEVGSYQEIMKKTNITIDFKHPPAGQQKEQFNLMLASNDLTDIMYYDWFSVPGGPAKTILDKQIIPLNDVMAQYAPNLTKLMAEKATVKKQSMLDDGTFYMFPMVRMRDEKEEWFRLFGPIYRQDWLDKLGLKIPQTLDELYVVLKAFKEKDPNGNGQPDEIPYIAQKSSKLDLAPMASAFGVTNTFYVDGTTVKYGSLEPAYKSYVETMNKWYKEGLIDPEYTITDSKAFNQKILSNQAGFYYGYLAANMGTYLDTAKGKDGFSLSPGPWVTGPGGKPYTSETEYVKIIVGMGKAISTSNKHVKETVKFLDYFYSEEGIRTSNFGIEGESFTMQEGKPTFTDLVLKSTDGLSVAQSLSKYALSSANDAMVKTSAYFEQTAFTHEAQRKTQEVWGLANVDLLMPPVSFTTEESTELAQIMNEVETFRDETLVKLIMGVTPMDQYDTLVKGIQGFNIERALQIQQAAFERYNKR